MHMNIPNLMVHRRTNGTAVHIMYMIYTQFLAYIYDEAYAMQRLRQSQYIIGKTVRVDTWQ